MTFELTICMPAEDMFENNDLYSEVCYQLEQGVNDGVLDLGEFSDLPFDEICHRISFNPDDLSAEYCERDMGTLYIYYTLPVTIN